VSERGVCESGVRERGVGDDLHGGVQRGHDRVQHVHELAALEGLVREGEERLERVDRRDPLVDGLAFEGVGFEGEA